MAEVTNVIVAGSIKPAFDGVQRKMHQIAVEHGFYDEDMIKTPLEEIALWHSECSEAAEECRNGQPLDRVWYDLRLPSNWEEQIRPLENRAEIRQIIAGILSAQEQIHDFGPEANVEGLIPSDEEWEVLVMIGFAKPEGYGVEAADVVIRIMDSLEARGISLWDMIRLKSIYNHTREPRHGKTK